MSRTAITGGLVADLATGVATPRDLLVEDGLITAVETAGAIDPAGYAVHDASDRLILPGFVNSHTHGHANLVKGVADRWTLEASLTNGPWMGGARDIETIYLSTLIGALDMLSKGCTACFDLVYEFPRPTVGGFMAVARAYADAGIKAVLAPMVADKTLFSAIPGLVTSLPPELRETVGSFALGDGDATLAAIESIITQRSSLPPGISLALAPTIPHHCSERFLLRHAELADHHGLAIHMHIAESRLQATVAQDLWGQSPVTYLAERGVLGPHFIAAHAVWLDSTDLDLLAKHRCRVAHIPASNFRLGAGVAHLRPMIERGIGIGLATDGANSSDALSMPQAIRLAAYASRIFDAPREDWLGAAETLRLATEGGADLLGLPRGGRIEVGAPADLTFFDLSHIDFLPLVDPLNQVVTAADSGAISDVMVDGSFAIRDHRPTRIDPIDLRIRVRDAVDRLAPSLANARALAGRLEPHVVAFARSQRHRQLPINRFLSVEGIDQP